MNGSYNASSPIPLPQSESVGTGNSVPVSGASHIYLRRMDRQADSVSGPSRFDRIVTAIAALLLGIAIAIWLSGCIPVTIRPQFDAKGLPVAIPVTPTGSVSADGTLTPIYPVSNESPKPVNWGAWGTAAGAVLTALLAAYGINLRGFASKAVTALKITADLADANACAETEAEVDVNKRLAAQLQESAGVRSLVRKARGK